MKKYVALQYILLGGSEMLTPGEILPPLDGETLKYLEARDAIRPATGETDPAPEAEPETEADETETEDAEEPEAEEAEEPVEIDALDGVVTAPAAETKPARKGGRKAK